MTMSLIAIGGKHRLPLPIYILKNGIGIENTQAVSVLESINSVISLSLVWSIQNMSSPADIALFGLLSSVDK